jgi:cytochrome P450
MEPRIRAIARALIAASPRAAKPTSWPSSRATAEPRDRRDDRRARGPPRGVPRLDRGDGRERRGPHQQTIQAATNIYAEFSKLLAERRSARRDDLMSALVDAELDGRAASEEDLLGFCFTLIVAGNDTTTNLIANGAVLLAEHPDQRARLVREPGGDRERRSRRWCAASRRAQALPRRLMRDVGVRGATIPKGAMVRLGVGRREPRRARVRRIATRFDITRPSPRHSDSVTERTSAWARGSRDSRRASRSRSCSP